MRKTQICKHCGTTIKEFVPSLHDCIVPYPPDIKRRLENLWFIRGNGGAKHNQQDHYYIQRLIEGRRAEAGRCSPTKECKKEVKNILEREEF